MSRAAAPLNWLRRLTVLAVFVGATLPLVVWASAPDTLVRYYRAYRLHHLEPVAGDPPRIIRVLPPVGPSSWPQPIRATLEARVRAEWPRDVAYGPLQTWVGLWLAYPLVTGLDGHRLLVPVIADTELPVRGVVDLPGPPGPRRIVLLLDASASVNARTLLRMTGGVVRRLSVLEAERRGLARLLEVFGRDEIELGVVAYGETARPLAKPGTPVDEIRERLERWEESHPRGSGRTDLVCALELARDWLRDTPSGVAREIFLLTDGDLPHSGRFTDCRLVGRRGGKSARAACESRRNTEPCPASRRFLTRDGYSDEVQLERFGRRTRNDLTVYPLLFDPTRSARLYDELANTTGGELFRIPSGEGLEAALPTLITRQVRSVHVFNERTGERSPDLLDPTTGRFEGVLPLAPGPNDVLLTVEGERGPAALYRFRIYAEPDHLRRALVDLRRENHRLEERADRLRESLAAQRRSRPSRELEVTPEEYALPAAPTTP